MSSRYTSLEGTRANSMQMTPMMHMYTEPYYYYMDNVHPTPTGRNRRVISTEESKAFLVDISKIESDGRTTIMVRNIPNKYTQDMLLDLFEKKHKKKFDFFYLPVDYNVLLILFRIVVMLVMLSSTLSTSNSSLISIKTFTCENGKNSTLTKCVKFAMRESKAPPSSSIILNIRQ